MTAQLGTPQEALLPALNFSVTHVGLQTRKIESARQEGRQVETSFAITRTVLLALNAVGGMPEARQLKDFFAWPTWQAPGIPKPSHKWTAIFGTQTRAFEGMHGAAPAGGQPTIIRNSDHIRVTDAMWQMLQAQECVVLCTGLAGDPTAAEFGAAAVGGKLQAVLARALFH
ncbi:hypothetical protein AB0P02_28075 [Streptomyces griseoluteus]|uniref:hypothetical protein n=1 Tax=Streptomyces TaxID=1883 RepID=UPI000A38AB45|nr:hypothetical protein [Streptomyces recifensis]